MRVFQLLFIILILSGCVKHHSVEGFDVTSIESSAIKLLESHPQNSIIKLEQLPLSLSQLKPYSVRIDKTGIYITLDESFVSESGLFIPRNGFTPDLSNSLDPSFKLLKNRTYSYLVKG